ncbi:MAG: hypothetical protein C0518_15660 [Opitutus sp.]|nr:hypothetical protein [Opitutus sp.]
MKPALRAALILVLGALVVGVGRWWRAEERAPRERELRIAYTDYLSPLDPRALRAVPSLTQRMTDAVWDELITFDQRSLTVASHAAESWESTDGGQRFLFRLSPTGRWSNGDPVTAEDFVRTVRWLLVSGSDHPLIRLLGDSNRSGAEPEGRDAIAVNALDPLTLEVRVKSPPPDFLPLLASLRWIPLHASTPAAFENGSWSRPGGLVSNGAYRLRHFGSEEILAELNPHHTSPPDGFERVRLMRTESPRLLPVLLAAGRIDFGDALNFMPAGMPSLPDSVTTEHENTASVSALQFNVSRPPLNDVRVRQALSLALDRVALAQRFGGGGALPAYSFTVPGRSGEPEQRSVIEDLALARRLLAEAGYPDGNGFPVLRIPMALGPDANPLPLFCADQWRARLGLRVYVPTLPRSEVTARAHHGDFDVMHLRWVASPLDFSVLALQFSGGLPKPFLAWPSEEAQAGILAARRLQGDALFRGMLAAERKLLNQMPASPLVYYHRYTFRSARVEGWTRDIFGRHPFENLRPVASAANQEGMRP